MQHDPNLARALPCPTREAPLLPRLRQMASAGLRSIVGACSFEAVCVGLVALAFILVPGRFLVVLAWPAAAPFLGFGR